MTMNKSSSTGCLRQDPRLMKLKHEYAQAGPAYFNNSVVGSSKGFFSVGHNAILARPFRTGAVRAKTVDKNAVGKSEYSTNFGFKRYCYSSMDNKPLSRYDPLAYRSRNALPDNKSQTSNSSVVDFDQGLHVDKKRQFYTTNSQYLKGKPVAVISNPGILAEQYRITAQDRSK